MNLGWQTTPAVPRSRKNSAAARNWAAFASDLNAPFPVLYISFPSAKAPTFEARYPAHQTIEVVVPAPYELFAQWGARTWKHRGLEYEHVKKMLADRLLHALYRYVPEVTGAVETWELSTPLSTQHFTSAARAKCMASPIHRPVLPCAICSPEHPSANCS